MDKCISAEAFKRKLIDEKNFYPAIVARVLDEMPAADVEEVRHGEWIEIVKNIGKGRTLTHYKCSLCGVYVSDKVNYCYHCGAKMDGGNTK